MYGAEAPMIKRCLVVAAKCSRKISFPRAREEVA
jgi:hypothetical protein